MIEFIEGIVIGSTSGALSFWIGYGIARYRLRRSLITLKLGCWDVEKETGITHFRLYCQRCRDQSE